MEGQPLHLQVIFSICAGAFIVNFAVILWVIMRVLGRTECLVDRPEDKGLSWGERQARKHSRFERYYVAEEFRSLRKAAAIAWTGATLSFATMLFLGLLFGGKTPH